MSKSHVTGLFLSKHGMREVTLKGALDGGSQCRMSDLRNCSLLPLLLQFPANFKVVQCRMLILIHGPCHVNNMIAHVDKLHVACRF